MVWSGRTDIEMVEVVFPLFSFFSLFSYSSLYFYSPSFLLFLLSFYILLLLSYFFLKICMKKNMMTSEEFTSNKDMKEFLLYKESIQKYKM